VEITVTLERGDYVHGYLWAYYLGVENRSAVAGLVLVLLLVLGLLSALARISAYRLALALWVAPILWLVWLLALVAYTYWRARITFQQRAWLQQPTRYTLDHRGIASQAPSYSGFRPWERIWRVEENGRSFLVYLSRVQVVVIPKRFLGDQDQVRAFRELVAQHCPRVNLLET
jgi:hypothetical protein